MHTYSLEARNTFIVKSLQQPGLVTSARKALILGFAYSRSIQHGGQAHTAKDAADVQLAVRWYLSCDADTRLLKTPYTARRPEAQPIKLELWFPEGVPKRPETPKRRVLFCPSFHEDVAPVLRAASICAYPLWPEKSPEGNCIVIHHC